MSKKILMLATPFIEYIGGTEWILGRKYPGDPHERIIHSIKKIVKNGEMAYVDWFEIKDEDGDTIGEVKGNSLCSIMYDKDGS